MPDYSMSDAKDIPVLKAPEPVHPWAAAIGKGLGKAHEALQYLGKDNPPWKAVDWALGLEPASRIMEDVGYGTTHLTDNTPRGRQWREDLAGAAPVLGMGTKIAGKTAWELAGKVPKIPHGQLNMFLAPGPREAPMLARAKELEAAGAPPEDVWAETGMMKWLDGEWKHEISDHSAALHALDFMKKTRAHIADRLSTLETAQKIRNYMDIGASEEGAIASVKRDGSKVNDLTLHYAKNHTYEELDDKLRSNYNALTAPIEAPDVRSIMSHPELEKHIPELLDNRVQTFEGNPGQMGYYSPSGLAKTPGTIGLEQRMSIRPTGGKRVMLHELQHAYDYSKGFDYGSSPDAISKIATNLRGEDITAEEAQRVYEQVSGEALARLTQNRSQLGPAERRAAFPLSMRSREQGIGIDVPPSSVRTMEDIYRHGVLPYNAPKSGE